MDSGKYTEAISAFEALDGYKDSTTKITECNTAILDGKLIIKSYEVRGMKESVIVDKSKAFALRIIKLYSYLCAEKQEY